MVYSVTQLIKSNKDSYIITVILSHTFLARYVNLHVSLTCHWSLMAHKKNWLTFLQSITDLAKIHICYDMLYRIGVSFILFAIVLYSRTVFRKNILPVKSKTGVHFWQTLYFWWNVCIIFMLLQFSVTLVFSDLVAGEWEFFFLLKSQPRLSGNASLWQYICKIVPCCLHACLHILHVLFETD